MDDSLPKRLPLHIVRGSTFRRVMRWEKEPFIYAPITGIQKVAPARITAAGHGLTDGWRVAVVSVQGMRQINAENAPPAESDFVRCTLIDPNTVDLNSINAAEFSAYVSGGYLQFYTPADLAGCSARMTVKDRIGGTVLLELTDASGITLDDTAKTITLQIEADDAAAFTWSAGVYDLEIEDGDGVVTKLFYGPVTVTGEVTT